MDNHILDRPVWSSLTSVHAHFSAGSNLARRFQDDISPFAAARDESTQSLSGLAELIPATGNIMVAQANPIICPPDSRATVVTTAAQMLFCESKIQPEKYHTIEQLNKYDAPAMLALATLTKPGPFLNRTHLLGEYLGVKHDGHLIAIAGERLKQPGYTEISGVCTHPDYQGRGLARELCINLVARIVDRGEKPYLHVFTNNTHAISLYEKLGFRLRRTIHVAQLECI
jgi:predicted GNAT family acetyltransferase